MIRETLIKVPRPRRFLPLEAASACRVFCRFLTATADEQLREDGIEKIASGNGGSLFYSTWPMSAYPTLMLNTI